MATKTIGVVIDGATGRLGTTQHLKALLAIRAEGGLPLKNGDRLMPEPLLLGRNAEKLAALAGASGGLRWSLDRDACLADKAVDIYFDATATGGRPERLTAAIDAHKHVYTEKPVAESLEQAMARGLLLRARGGSADPAIGDTLCLAPPLMTPTETLATFPQIIRDSIAAATA